MSLVKITFDAASVTSKMDADLNHFLASSVNGVFYGILGGCRCSTSNNYISFQSGYAQVYGRRVYVESGTRISVSLDRTAYGYVAIRVDLGKNAVTLEKKEASSGYPSLTQEDLMNGGLVYELPLCRYTKTTSSVTLDDAFSPTYIRSAQDRVDSMAESVKAEVSAEYGPHYQALADSSSGSGHKFSLITSSNSLNGVIGVYLKGAYVTFMGRAVAGSGGIIRYTYLGTEYMLSAQLTSTGLVLEDSRGTTPKYVTVTN